MIPILDLSTAQKTVLRRAPLNLWDFPPSVVEKTQALFGEGVTPPQAVARILASIREEGDAALRRWSALLDRTVPKEFRLSRDAMRKAWEMLPTDLASALRLAAQRIRAFHERQPLPSWEHRDENGVLGQRLVPIERVGVYVPGGSAPLPSSLLMSVIPAQVAGVETIVVCTPPEPHPTILAAAYLCEVEHFYQVGGAQAIGAMAFGTESVPKVDKIVGAGNLWVTLAKQQVFGVVGLDGLAGPTETMIIADGSANPDWVAADLLAQAEHDPLASAILLTPDSALAARVQEQIAHQIERLSRAEIISQSLASRSGIVLTPDLETAADLANEYAPEHLCLSVADPEALLPRLRHSGGIFIGEHSFEVLGDYVAGPSHVMPTGGSARFNSPLNALDFVKVVSLIGLTPQAGEILSRPAAVIAQAETLTAHAAAAEKRFSG